MVQLLCLIMGFVYLAQRGKIVRADASQFPGVPPAEFDRWRDLELRSIDIFLWATGGTFILGIAIVIVSFAAPGFIGFFLAQVGLFGLFLAGLVVSAVFGTQAASLKKKLGISFRKKS